MDKIWSAFEQLINKMTDTVDVDSMKIARTYFKECNIKKGAHFIRQGEICKRLAFVYSGIFRSYYINESGEEITYCFCTDNEMETSFRSFIDCSPSSLSIVALEDCYMLEIERDDLNTLLDTSLFWNKISRLLVENEYLKMADHAAGIKTETAKQKYLHLLEERPKILQQVPLHYIASYLGISSRHLTRLRGELIQK